MTHVAQHRPIVLAHRGLHGDARPHENSIGAFEAAAQAGADVIELDVRRTRDGVLVVHHDPVTATGQRISDVDYARLDRLPDGQRIPTLDEAIELARRRGRQLLVELKEQGYEVVVANRLATLLPLAQFRMMSFEPAAMERIERALPQIRTGVIVPYVPDWIRDGLVLRLLPNAPIEAALAGAAGAGTDFVMIHHLFASRRRLATAKARGLDVYVTTLDDPARLARFLCDPRVDGVMTNRADVAVAVRDALRGARSNLETRPRVSAVDA